MTEADAEALLACYGIAALGEEGYGGLTLSVAVLQDANFGPILACGPRASFTDPGRVMVRITPLTTEDAASVARGLPLERPTGSAECDIGGGASALQEFLLRLSALVEGHHEVAEVDCGHVVVHAAGVAVLGPRVRIQVSPQPRPVSARRA
jgi:hypothetical protein